MRIDGDAPPPLADAQADLDATITTLLTELGAAGLDTASLVSDHCWRGFSVCGVGPSFVPVSEHRIANLL